jgi:uncharacterized membrane protein YkvA (DUF1232 family)
MILRTRRIPWERAARFEFRTLLAAIRDRRTPWRAKLLVLFVIAYALWPFDLIPDFVPVVGWIDDLIIVPAGLWLAWRMIPETVLANVHPRAANGTVGRR